MNGKLKKMSHLIEDEPVKERTLRKIRLPHVVGKFGVSLLTGKKEFFLGLAVADVELERVVRKRKMRTLAPGSKVRIFPYEANN